MIAKPANAKPKRPRRPKTPMELQLTVSFRFGDEPNDRITVLDNRRVPLVGSIFDSRDAIVRGFLRMVMKAAAMQPKVARELLPALRLLRPGR